MPRRSVTELPSRKYLRTLSIAGLSVLVFLCGLPVGTKALASDFLEHKRGRESRALNAPSEMRKLGGLNVAIWRPSQDAATKRPLLLFSHGFLGCNTQSNFLMKLFADSGYLVVAPNHKDSLCERGSRGSKPEWSFIQAFAWTPASYKDRRDDMYRLIDALHEDAELDSEIDWTRVGLVGHSLGGYTVLGLAGGWPSWKMRDVKAVLALSPYCHPLAANGDLASIGIPVMYQSGTADLGVAPFVKRPAGCFAKNSSPAIYVEFKGAGHLAWTDFSKTDHQLIGEYSVAFLDKYVRGGTRDVADPSVRKTGVSDLRVK